MENQEIKNSGLIGFLMDEEYKFSFLSDPREWVWYNSESNKLFVVGSFTNYFLVKKNLKGLAQVGEL